MNKLIAFLLSVVMVAAAFLQPMPAAAASTSTAVFTFADLGVSQELVLHGPYDSRSIRFQVPATWSLQPGAKLELEITSFFVGNNSAIANDYLGAVLDVSFNTHLQQSIALVKGDKITYEVPIAAEDLVSPYEDGSHVISFFLDAAVDCNFDFHNTTVVLTMNSKLSLPYGETSISLDLRKLPWPIYMQRNRAIDPVTLVLPKSPTAGELQAGLIVMGAFGRMTNGKLPLNSLTADQLTQDIQNQSNLIFVGKASAFPALAAMKLPVPISGSAFTSAELAQDDGVVQMIPSQWNTSRVILVVSGNTDAGVVKSAQAVSTANLQTGLAPNYSIIAQVNPYPAEGSDAARLTFSKSPDMTLADLGYSFSTATGIGTQWVSFNFIIPAGQVATEGAYIDFNISASTLIDPLRSDGVVYLNDVQIGSISLASDTSNVIKAHILLPVSAIKSGLNVIDLVFNLLPKDECSLFNFNGLWLTVFPDSNLHLPLQQQVNVSKGLTLKDLKSYPSPFANDPSLSSTVFVLSDQDPYSWLMAEKMAYDLGTRVTNPVLGFQVAFDGQLTDTQKTSNLILIGQPKNLPILEGLQEVMPASYEAGSNLAVLESEQVVYRISAEKSLGYLQLFNSPWNTNSAVLGIFGTNSAGLLNATNALLDVTTRDTLAGNFATLDGVQSLVADTRTGAGLGRLSSSLGSTISQSQAPIPTAVPVIPTIATNINNKDFIFFGILVVLALIAIVAVVALSLRRKRS